MIKFTGNVVAKIFPCLLLLLNACSALLQTEPTGHYAGNKSSEVKINFDEKNADARYYFLTSELLLKQENFEEGLELLEKADLLLDKPSPTILKRLTQLYLRTGNLDKALVASERMVQLAPTSVEALQLKAGTLGALGRVDEAIQCYQEIIEIQNPVQEEPYLLLAGMLVQNTRPAEAISVFKDLISKVPDSFIAHYYSAKLYLSLGQKQDAIDYYEKALKLSPISLNTLNRNFSVEQVELELIQALAMNGQIEAATRSAQQLVNKSPGNAKARQILAELLLGEKKIEQALVALEEARDLGAGGDDLALRVALIKLGKKDFGGAEADLNLLLGKNAEHHEARYYLATALASQGEIEESARQLEQIPTSSELYKKARGFAAFLLRQENQYKRALALIEQALIEFPDDLELLAYKASIERESGAIEKAIESLRRISRLEPSNEQHLFNLAVALDEASKGDQERRDEAISIMEQIIKINPLHANALNYIGYSLAEKGSELDRAEELVKKALEIEPQNGYFVDSLGWIYYQSGDYQKAVMQLEKANELTPADPVILEHLGRAYLKLDRVAEARRTLERSYELLKVDDKQQELMLEIKSLLDSLR